MYLPSRRLALRLIAGSWCILAFVLVTAYQSVLISYIVTPVMQSPLANSIAELANNKDAQVVVEKGFVADTSITVNCLKLRAYSLIIEVIKYFIDDRILQKP